MSFLKEPVKFWEAFPNRTGEKTQHLSEISISSPLFFHHEKISTRGFWRGVVRTLYLHNISETSFLDLCGRHLPDISQTSFRHLLVKSNFKIFTSPERCSRDVLEMLPIIYLFKSLWETSLRHLSDIF